MAQIWNRYAILSEAFEASVQRLGLVDAMLGVVVGGSLAGMGFFLATKGEEIAAALLLAPFIVAVQWVTNIEYEAASRSEREIALLVDGHSDDKQIAVAVRSLGDGYRRNALAYESKSRGLRSSATLFLVIVSLGVTVPYVIALLAGARV